jgi:hypothetical protein
MFPDFFFNFPPSTSPIQKTALPVRKTLESFIRLAGNQDLERRLADLLLFVYISSKVLLANMLSKTPQIGTQYNVSPTKSSDQLGD